MPRSPRIERPGAWHHVTARGNERRPIYRDDRDRLHFCALLGQAVTTFAWRLHAYVLMNNHFHLLIETPEPNLGRGMQWLNTSYSVWFNRRHQRAGHLLQGRFKSIIVDPVAWALEVSRYLHLNPVRVGRLGLGKATRQRDRVGAATSPDPDQVKQRIHDLRQWRWSSYRAYLDLAKTPPWLHRERIWELGGFRDDVKATYRGYVESAIRQGLAESPWEHLRAGIVLGAAAFARRIADGIGSTPDLNRRARRQLIGRPTVADVIAAVETVKREKWQTFRDRHGDWGRDLVFYLGRKDYGLKLNDLGHAAGLGPIAVSIAVKRTSSRLPRTPALQSALQKCRHILNVLNG